MGLVLRNGYYYYRKRIQHRHYRIALGLKRGQEALLSARLK